MIASYYALYQSFFYEHEEYELEMFGGFSFRLQAYIASAYRIIRYGSCPFDVAHIIILNVAKFVPLEADNRDGMVSWRMVHWSMFVFK